MNIKIECDIKRKIINPKMTKVFDQKMFFTISKGYRVKNQRKNYVILKNSF